MNEILPQYGIELRIIPRIGVDGEAISASKVRRLLRGKQFEEIKKIVPQTTYQYLLDSIF